MSARGSRNRYIKLAALLLIAFALGFTVAVALKAAILLIK